MFSKLSIRRPVTTVMIILIVCLCGIVSLLGLKMDLMPSMDIPIAIVSTSYSGAGPEEIENIITKPIEEVLGTVSNVDTIQSTSSAGSSIVMVQFEDGTDIDMATLDMREKIDLIKGYLPDGSSDPMVLKLDMNSLASIVVGVTSDMKPYELTEFLDSKVLNRLERIEGVASVSLTGNTQREIQVVVNQEKLQGYGVTVSQISSYLMAENINYPSGNVEDGIYNLQLRTVGEFKSVDDIKNLPIMTATGGLIRLSDVADVSENTTDNTTNAYINGEHGIIVSISKQSNANIVDVSNEIEEELEKINRDYGEIDIFMLSNTSDYIKVSVKNVLQTAILSTIMAFIVLYVFLRSIKPSLVIAVSIPTSILATFATMYVVGIGLNIISLGGISIGIGMLVDNSVVILENIYRYRKLGYEAKEAAYLGAKEMSLSVMASTLTTVAVFIPLVFISGMVGQVFFDLSVTICAALIASLIVSITFVPMACSVLLKEDVADKPKKETRATKVLDKIGSLVDSLDTVYRKALNWCITHQKKTIVGTIIIFVLTLCLIPIMGFNLMPSMDQGTATISISLPNGSKIEETEAVTNEVLEIIADIPEIDVYYVTIGGDSSSSLFGADSDKATISLNLVGKDHRKRTTVEVAQDIQERVDTIAGAEITATALETAMGNFSDSSVTLQVNGTDMDMLMEAANDVRDIVATVDGVINVETSVGDTVPQANIVINRNKASVYGLTAAQVGSALSEAVTGKVATTYKVDGTEIDVRIMSKEENVDRLNDIYNIVITSPTGVNVPLSEIADIVIEESSSSINRMNQTKYISISGTIIDRDSNSVMKDVEAKLDNYIFPEGTDYQFTGSMEMLEDTFSDLMIVLIVAILLVYMIMASQFESLLNPFIVMFSVPLALTGGIFGMFITGNSISVVSFMGFIMLVGMVVNNAIVLIDYTNQLRVEGYSCDEALEEAGPTRLRPILMTTLTTVLGLIPSAVMTTEGLEMQQPLSITVIFGLTISTVVTLLFVPVVYSIFDKIRVKRRERKAAKKAAKNNI